jgi:hypothetical protein
VKALLATFMLVGVASLALAEDQPAEAAQVEPALELSGNLDVKAGLIQARTSSVLYRLGLGQAKLSQPLSQYILEPYLNADYATSQVGFHAKAHGVVLDGAEPAGDLLGLYGTLSPTYNWSILAGQKAFNWGRGYAFNPVGFINPVKDPENPELQMAGRPALSVEYNKSFEAASLSLQAVMLPPDRTVSRLGEAQGTGLALKVSALVWDTDLDLMGYFREAEPRRLGGALSRNLSSNLEFHGELGASWLPDQAARASGLAGLRYLNSLNTTVIVEYFHQGQGFSPSEFKATNGYLESALASGQPAALQQAALLAKGVFSSGVAMQDYAYVKLTQPEPLGWVHATPSLTALVNLHDGSGSLAAPLSYKPITNFELIFWPSWFLGTEDSEFGSKQFEQRYEVWLKFYFG